MEKKGGHVLAVPYPAQGHITPMLQFCKRLHFKGLKTTLALTTFIFNSIKPDPSGPISIATISDGYDQGGFESASSVDEYLKNLKTFGSKTIVDIIIKHQTSDDPITCIVYDAFMPWALDVAREFGLAAAPYFTQPCAVNYVYYLSYINQGSLKFPIEELPFLEFQDLPSFLSVPGVYPAFFEMMLQQFINFDKADFVLVNSFLDLERYEKELLSKVCHVLTIGPTIPSMYLDQRIKSDTNYDMNLFDLKDAAFCTDWLNTKPTGSVVYVAFGSFAELSAVQMEELAFALRNFSYLWVVRGSEEAKLPLGFLETVDKDKSLVLKWIPKKKKKHKDPINISNLSTRGARNSRKQHKELLLKMKAELNLPAGFRFHPTDEELVKFYLCRRCASEPISVPVIAEIDLYKFNPWELPEMALYGEKEWYFFSHRDRKYPNGSRPNRAAGTGYWKATGADKPIGKPKTLGIKKALVFYAGKAPKGIKTNWIMHEYRLANVDRSASTNKKNLRLDDWVLCRIYNKKGTMEKYLPADEKPTVMTTSDSRCSSHVTCSDNNNNLEVQSEPKWCDLDDAFEAFDTSMFNPIELLQNDAFVPRFPYQSDFLTPFEDPPEQKPFANWSFGPQG